MLKAEESRYEYNTARAIVIKEGHILLIERWRDGRHYYSIPGGKIEPGEEPEQTAEREIKEETTIDISVNKLLIVARSNNNGSNHFIYLAEYLSGQPILPDDSEEAQQGPDNRFKPLWLPLSDFENINLGFWEPLKPIILEELSNGFTGKVKNTTI